SVGEARALQSCAHARCETYGQILQQCKCRARLVARHLAQRFAVHLVSAFTNSINTAVVAGPFRVLVEPGTQTEVFESASELALWATIHVQPRELSAELRAYKAIANAVKIIFKVNKAAAEPHIARQINPVRGEPTRPVALP